MAKYTARVIKGGALLNDSKLIIKEWDISLSFAENRKRIIERNILGKPSRSRVSDILQFFRRRYLGDSHTVIILKKLLEAGVQSEIIDRIMYYHIALTDALIYDYVTDYLYQWYREGREEVIPESTVEYLRTLAKSKDGSPLWNEYTMWKIALNLLVTLRDCHILKGKKNKKIAPAYLPLEVFLYIAYRLWQQNIAGQKIINHSDWHLFLLDQSEVERLFIEGEQKGYLAYRRAGEIIRIEFFIPILEDLADLMISGGE